MSQQPPDHHEAPSQGDQPTVDKPDGLASLTVEDEPGGTVHPAELAGTAKESDVGYTPEFSEADDPSGRP